MNIIGHLSISAMELYALLFFPGKITKNRLSFTSFYGFVFFFELWTPPLPLDFCESLASAISRVTPG